MVLCTDCKHFVITTLLEGDYCEAIDEILDDNLVYDDLECDFFDSVDGRLPEGRNQ